MSSTSLSAILTPITATRAPEAIVRRLKDAIATGELPPGSKLPPEAELARLLGVATMTLRQALAVLKELGLIESRRGRNGGTFILSGVGRSSGLQRISPMTQASLRDLTDWRKGISGQAAALAAERMGDQNAAQLLEASLNCERLLDDPEHYRRADADLHILIAALSGSHRLLIAETALQQEFTELFLHTTDLPRSRKIVRHSHAELVEAISRGKPEMARVAMQNHAESTFEWLLGLNIFPDQ